MYTNQPEEFLKSSELSGPPNYIIYEEPCQGEDCENPIATMFLPFVGLAALVFAYYHLAPALAGQSKRKKKR